MSPVLEAPRRIACVEACQIEGHSPPAALVWNLSVRGVYVVVDPAPALGRKVRIAFSLPNEKRPVMAEARVAWRNPGSKWRGRGAKVFGLPPGCGLEFLVVDRADLERIEGHIRMTPVVQRRATA